MKTTRSLMTMRCDIERNVQSGTDAYNQPIYQWQTVGVDVSCRFWSETGRTINNEGSAITLHTIKGVLSLDADITKDDQITRVTDRRGSELFGKLKIDAIERRPDHVSIIAEHYE